MCNTGLLGSWLHAAFSFSYTPEYKKQEIWQKELLQAFPSFRKYFPDLHQDLELCNHLITKTILKVFFFSHLNWICTSQRLVVFYAISNAQYNIALCGTSLFWVIWVCHSYRRPSCPIHYWFPKTKTYSILDLCSSLREIVYQENSAWTCWG